MYLNISNLNITNLYALSLMTTDCLYCFIKSKYVPWNNSLKPLVYLNALQDISTGSCDACYSHCTVVENREPGCNNYLFWRCKCSGKMLSIFWKSLKLWGFIRAMPKICPMLTVYELRIILAKSAEKCGTNPSKISKRW